MENHQKSASHHFIQQCNIINGYFSFNVKRSIQPTCSKTSTKNTVDSTYSEESAIKFLWLSHTYSALYKKIKAACFPMPKNTLHYEKCESTNFWIWKVTEQHQHHSQKVSQQKPPLIIFLWIYLPCIQNRA